MKTPEQLDDQMEMLKEVKAVLIKHGQPPILHSGIVLGIHREGDFIPWDTDCEIFVLYGRVRKRRKAIVNDFSKLGYQVTGSSKRSNWKIRLRKNGYKFEIDGWKLGDGYHYNYLKKGRMIYMIPEKYFNNLKVATLRGEQFYIPEDTEKYLEWLYGDWRTPVGMEVEYLTSNYKRKVE